MNLRKSNLMNMFKAVVIHCTTNPLATATISAFAVVFAILQNKIDLIIQNQQIIQNGTSGVTIASLHARERMTTFASRCANALLALGHQTGNDLLIRKVDYSLSDFKRMKKEDVSVLCKTIADLVNFYLTALAPYGITPADAADLQSSIVDYTVGSQNPRYATITRKEAGEQNDLIMKDIEENILKKQMDPMVRSLLPIEPSFVRGYFNAREVVDLGKNITKIRGVITDANGVALPGITLTIRNYASNIIYNVVTDFSGRYSISNIQSGDYLLKVIGDGYQPVVEEGVHLVAGREVDRSFQLSRAA